MSLTSFVKLKQVRDKFQYTFDLPNFNCRTPLSVAPLTENYMLVGTAFDYLLRFYLKHLNPNAITNIWIAELAVQQIPETFGWSSPYAIFGRAWYEQIYKKGLEIINQSKRLYAEYLIDGIITRDIIKSALLLAQLDRIFREGRLHKDFGIVDEADIVDLNNLAQLVNPQIFSSKSICLLNPTFGEASMLVGGADADVLIDDTLVDIKTTKYLKFDWQMFNQLVGYYILYKISGIGDVSSGHQINKLAIYYSRHGELFTFDVKNLMVKNSLSQLIHWFEAEARNCFKKYDNSSYF